MKSFLVLASVAAITLVAAPVHGQTPDRPAVLGAVDQKASAMLVNFGVSDAALLDVATGKRVARGRLPFELPSSMEAVAAQDPAVADDSRDPLYRRGAGRDTPRPGRE